MSESRRTQLQRRMLHSMLRTCLHKHKLQFLSFRSLRCLYLLHLILKSQSRRWKKKNHKLRQSKLRLKNRQLWLHLQCPNLLLNLSQTWQMSTLLPNARPRKSSFLRKTMKSICYRLSFRTTTTILRRWKVYSRSVSRTWCCKEITSVQKETPSLSRSGVRTLSWIRGSSKIAAWLSSWSLRIQRT